MKVYIGPYINRWTTTRLEHWFLERLYGKDHWLDKYQDKTGAKVISGIGDVFQAFLNYTINLVQDRRERKIKVKIHNYDTWCMDSTLSPIILPMLKQLKEESISSGFIDNEDLPLELQHNNNSSNETDQYDMFADDEYDEAVWATYQARWNYILDSMIFSFEKLNENDWEQEFYSGEIDHEWVEAEEGNGYTRLRCGPDHTFEVDRAGMKEMDERIQFGLRMFGKYFRSLWD